METSALEQRHQTAVTIAVVEDAMTVIVTASPVSVAVVITAKAKIILVVTAEYTVSGRET
jgi:hypothetical protein